VRCFFNLRKRDMGLLEEIRKEAYKARQTHTLYGQTVYIGHVGLSKIQEITVKAETRAKTELAPIAAELKGAAVDQKLIDTQLSELSGDELKAAKKNLPQDLYEQKVQSLKNSYTILDFAAYVLQDKEGNRIATASKDVQELKDLIGADKELIEKISKAISFTVETESEKN